MCVCVGGTILVFPYWRCVCGWKTVACLGFAIKPRSEPWTPRSHLSSCYCYAVPDLTWDLTVTLVEVWGKMGHRWQKGVEKQCVFHLTKSVWLELGKSIMLQMESYHTNIRISYPSLETQRFNQFIFDVGRQGLNIGSISGNILCQAGKASKGEEKE